MKKFFALLLSLLLLTGALGAGFAWWAQQPILEQGAPIEFTIKPGSSLPAAMQQIQSAGVPVQAAMLGLLARLSDKGGRIKAGTYELKPGTTPAGLLNQLVRGEFAQESLVIIEGWTFRQMREAIAAHPALKHDTRELSDAALLQKLEIDYKLAEGLFFPDTYLFAKGASDMQIYRQAHAALMRRLGEQWDKRAKDLPYKSPYQALIMASIVEKETGQRSERAEIAGVFVNRLRLGMLLQTDPTVIYGMGEKYQGKIYKRDLETDTPYNTYTRAGLPPSPIALPGAESLAAALAPAKTESLYFVARGDGSSKFSSTLDEHNRAVNKYQRNQP
ncbi:endolytic transglycosylase MltG [Massilia sp. W12]|uniref:endolytic transglycosylase MltG n=1 Tax=Massilia sp. W12 TaxID=3126507 RepID=UPI0030CB6E19